MKKYDEVTVKYEYHHRIGLLYDHSPGNETEKMQRDLPFAENYYLIRKFPQPFFHYSLAMIKCSTIILIRFNAILI